jgi:hypothetical protein
VHVLPPFLIDPSASPPTQTPPSLWCSLLLLLWLSSFLVARRERSTPFSHRRPRTLDTHGYDPFHMALWYRHVAHDAVRQASLAAGVDYLTAGFVAPSRKEEIVGPNYEVTAFQIRNATYHCSREIHRLAYAPSGCGCAWHQSLTRFGGGGLQTRCGLRKNARMYQQRSARCSTPKQTRCDEPTPHATAPNGSPPKPRSQWVAMESDAT